MALLSLNNLKVGFVTASGCQYAVDDVSFDIEPGETFALLGESGCGKSMTALAIMQLLPPGARYIDNSQILLQEKDLLEMPEVKMRKVRGRRIAMIFQEPMTSLNPVLTVGEQIAETVRCHFQLSDKEVGERVYNLLYSVGIPSPKQRINEYPHQLSGGMKQRVMIAIALAGEPDLLIADEPTTALDVTIQAQVLQLLNEIQKKTGMALLLITHDLGVVAETADRLAVMYAGHIVETAVTKEFFANPRHPYSKQLFAAVPSIEKRNQPLAMIAGSVPRLQEKYEKCRFLERCESATSICQSELPSWHKTAILGDVRCHLPEEKDSTKPEASKSNLLQQASHQLLMEVRDLKVHFPIRKGIFKRTIGCVKAVDGVDLRLFSGKTLALVGESGCGKTTLGKSILQLIPMTAGKVNFAGNDLSAMTAHDLHKLRKECQIIFQDPYSSMNPRMLVKDIVAEGMLALGVGKNDKDRQARVDHLLKQVGLSKDAKFRYPHEFSGGQRQRIAIARALAVEPKLLICDEPTSALDVSVQAQILNLFKDLQQQFDLGYLFITHNMSVVAYMADEVSVMYLGRIVEHGQTEDILKQPKHPYTQALLSAVPQLEVKTQRQIIKLSGEQPSPIDPPSGCHFHPRCSYAMPVCFETYPCSKALTKSCFVKCHLYSKNKF